MRDREFDVWLQNEYVGRNGAVLSDHDRASRLWAAQRIEQYEGDLDRHYDRDRMAGLLDRLAYARSEAARGAPPRHKIPVGVNAYSGTATYRHVASLYAKFRQGPGATIPSGGAPRAATTRRVAGQRDWPAWEQPSDEEMLALARAVTPLVRFLHPDVVRAVVDDNRRHAATWRAALAARGVAADDYLWDGAATAFPGVRRHAGAAEIQHFRSGQPADLEGALRLDDNTYPKHIWSFTLRGRPFQQFGPTGYELAHLLDHKANKHRGPEELIGPVTEVLGAHGLPGLFTSAANAAYVPTAYLRPTDFSPPLRNLLQRRAAELYERFCRLLPGGLRIRDAASPEWRTSAFAWAAPVGTTTHVATFLEFRRLQLAQLMAVRQP